VDENGELVEAEAELMDMAAVGYDYGYDGPSSLREIPMTRSS
jgi:hypothetical protein